MSITGCRFSISAKVLVTSSLDSEGKQIPAGEAYVVWKAF